MVFSSLVFISIFLPLVFLCYQLLPGIRLKNGWLLIASLVFYAYGEPVCIFLLIFSAFMNYLFGRGVAGGKKRWVLVLAVFFNLGVLIVFKYATFLMREAAALTGIAFPIPAVPFPIGVSFFTFQALSYVIDVYRGDTKAQKNFLTVLLYISLFPQLVAGPIVRYRDVEKELSARCASAQDIAWGLNRFIAGLAKKVLIANSAGVIVDTLFQADRAEIFVLSAWLGAIAYMLQIYFDFSGYSDMAIGMGRMFGFHFNENFREPYQSSGVREFWRRWHISLSTWFREYLYIPLGGNRKSFARTLWNRFFVFLCTGIWHGANWTFLVWGIYHGLFLTAEELIGHTGKGGQERQKTHRSARLRSFFCHLYTLLVVGIGFVIFRANTLGQAVFWIRQMFGGFHFERNVLSLLAQMLTPSHLAALAAGILFSGPLAGIGRRYADRSGWHWLSGLVSIILLMLCMLQLASGTFNPFIYFQF